MYKAINGSDPNTSEWQDGMFSQAVPLQDYQASTEEFESGSMGALRIDPRSGQRRVAGHRRILPLPRHGQMNSLVGFGNAFRDGSLGNRTFLPAFTAQQMRGLGGAYRAGVLGDAASDPVMGAACDAMGPCVVNYISARQGKGEPLDVSLKVPFNQIMVASILGIAAYLYFKR